MAASDSTSSQSLQFYITSIIMTVDLEVTAVDVEARTLSKQRTKSKKTKKTEKDIAAKEAASSQIPETDITSLKLTLASEVTAINVDQLDIVPSIPEETDKKPEITDVPKAEKKDSKKIKKKSKKRTKSKKTKETEKDIAAKEGAISQIPETDITSPNRALGRELTAIFCRSAGHCSLIT
ncbi:conserved hypothetical protein [Trichinella spiralis]|uniref:hypothetical protein n=1 Tax=Trichinella spiralis TaxID=6334 RepID=UPI0001EFE42B|nr:conserved hypothetical protein [Trichinella spiralis]